MGEALTMEARQERDCAIVTVAGKIDISTVTRLRDRLCDIAATGRPLVVGLDQVSFIDSVGLAVLVGTANRAADGGSLRAACAPPKIRQLLRLTGLDCRILLARTPDEALKARAATPANPAYPESGPPSSSHQSNSAAGLLRIW